MELTKIVLSNFRCFNEEPTEIAFDRNLTCLVGNNGSGKTTLIIALKRLFGLTSEDRRIIKEDFYRASVDNNPTKDQKLFIEVIFSFPELKQNAQKARDTCPAFSSIIYADKEDSGGDVFRARMRLEAIWSEAEYEDEVPSKLYWVKKSQKVEFGDDDHLKEVLRPHDRKKVRLRYIPAFRDSKATLRNEVKFLTKILEDYTDISPEQKNEIENSSKQLSDKIQNLESINTVKDILKKVWSQTHDKTLKHYQEPKLESVPTEIGSLLRSISIKLAPSEDGRSKEISELSDGQISLLYFTLSITLYEIEQTHLAGEAKGLKVLDKDNPVFTIFAFEEPENHLSPYYLGRVLKVLYEITDSLKAIGIVTSHSASVVRRMEKVEQIRHFRQETKSDRRYSLVNSIIMPPQKSDEDYKYINQAVLAHPELYFSKLVILGEGDSEEIVIPQIAKRLGFDLDPSFVAFVKLGGRHVNHMWRLLEGLGIPYLTLLDMDLGRNGGGCSRIQYIINELQKAGKEFTYPSGITKENSLSRDEIQSLAKKLEEYGVFYSYPLDLDLAMIRAFPEFYNCMNAKSSDRIPLLKAVLGSEYNTEHEEIYSDEELKLYRYLFSTKSKVASHYKAMEDISNLDSNQIRKQCPDFLKRLIEKCSYLLKREEEE